MHQDILTMKMWTVACENMLGRLNCKNGMVREQSDRFYELLSKDNGKAFCDASLTACIKYLASEYYPVNYSKNYLIYLYLNPCQCL